MMKNHKICLVCLVTLLLLTSPCIAATGQVTNEMVSQIIRVISVRLNYDNYWGDRWVFEKPRELRIVSVTSDKYAAALELLSNDWGKKANSDHYQILLIRLDGLSPVVTFPMIPYTLQDLEKSDGDIGWFSPKVDASYARLLKETGKHVVTHMTLHKQARVYEHDEEWQEMITCLESELIDTVQFERYSDGIFILHDVIESDESLDGVLIANNGNTVETLIGTIHKRGSAMYKYHCELSNTLPPMNRLDPEWLSLILRKPLIWRFTLNEQGKCLLNRVSTW